MANEITCSRGRREVQAWKQRGDSSIDQHTLKVPLVYYLTRNGHLLHPHFVEVPLSSSEGLYLRDVIDRLVILRGRGMVDLYSWSCKRSYRNGFVWHDLEENDFVYPSHGQEYVLKGTELFHGEMIRKFNEIETSSSSGARRPPPVAIRKPGNDDSDFPIVTRQMNQSWTTNEFNEYKVYKSDSDGRKAAANASTQTEERRSRRRTIATTVVEKDEREEKTKPENISQPPSLASLMKSDRPVILCPATKELNNPIGHLRSPSILTQLITCGFISFKDCGPSCWKEEGESNSEEENQRQGLNLISYYKRRLPHGRRVEKVKTEKELKEYFSGSLIETKKDEIPILKRSASYTAPDR